MSHLPATPVCFPGAVWISRGLSVKTFPFKKKIERERERERKRERERRNMGIAIQDNWLFQPRILIFRKPRWLARPFRICFSQATQWLAFSQNLVTQAKFGLLAYRKYSLFKPNSDRIQLNKPNWLK